MPSQSGTKQVLGVLSLLTVIGIVFCTLWPFNPFPPNKVDWLKGPPGIRFERDGVVLSPEALTIADNHGSNSECSMEIWIQPSGTQGTSTLLDIYRPENPFQFLLRQYRDGLIVSQDVFAGSGETKRIKIDLDHGLVSGVLTLVTITSSEKGTRLYLDGTLKETYPKFRFAPDKFAGQIILGTSPVDSQPWSGEIRGLGVYSGELTPETVKQHFQEWKAPMDTPRFEEQKQIAIYAFGEHQGNVVHAQRNNAVDLSIPPHFFVPHQAFLRAPWKEFDPGWEYWADVLRNVIGFLPLGLFFYGYLSFTLPRQRALFVTILCGFALSLSVEMIQAFLPQRVSGMTDVLTNTLGTALGALFGAVGAFRWFTAGRR